MDARTLDCVLLFDVEDILSPPELGNDDSIKELADIMTAEGLPGIFLFIGDKARLLRERGRVDVIESLRGHEVGLHTYSALPPRGPEYVAGRSWEAGLEESLRRERDGVEIIRSVFGRPACAISTHSLFASPHALRSAAILGLPYVYAFPAAPPLYSLSRYCGALVLPWHSPTLDGRSFLPYWDGFDDYYGDPPALDAFVAPFDRRVDECLAAGQPFMSVLLYHPQRVRLAEFIDLYLTPNGKRTIPSADSPMPPRYPPERVRANLDGFRRLAKKIRGDTRLRPITMAQLTARYGVQSATIPGDELAEAAGRIVHERAISLHRRWSPAEIHVALARSLVRFEEEGGLPAHVLREDAMGPTTNPILHPEVDSCDWNRLVGFARETLAHFKSTGHLPANLGQPRLGANHLHLAFAQAYQKVREGGRVERIKFDGVPRYPRLAVPIGQRFMEAAELGSIDPDLNIDSLFRHGKLQTWTLKPAEGI